MRLYNPVNRSTELRALEMGGITIYFSYETPIAVYRKLSNTLLIDDYFYSVTTSKHREEIKRLLPQALHILATSNAISDALKKYGVDTEKVII